MAHILVVEDEPLIARLFQKSLEMEKHTCELTGNGKEAFESLIAPDNYFDLIISDQNMPFLTGCELALKISEFPEFSSIPFIILSADHDTRNIESLLEKRIITSFIHKPFSIYDLLDKVGELTTGAAMLTAQ